MHVTERSLGGAAILALDGDLRTGCGYRPGALGNHVERLARAGTRLIVLDLANVASADAMGIGEIAGAYTRARQGGANLKLVNPRPRVSDLLTLANLPTLIDVCHRLEQALEPFSLWSGGSGAPSPTKSGLLARVSWCVGATTQ